jgi:hypothetical protein
MNSRHLFRTTVCCMFVTAFAIGSDAQDATLRFNLGAGLSIPIDKDHKLWNPGFSINPSGYYFITDNFLIGLRLGYGRWSPDRKANLAAVGHTLTNASVEGADVTWEIVPVMRLSSNRYFKFINYYGQVGLGVFIRDATARVSGTLGGSAFKTEVIDDNQSRLGITLAVGLVLGAIDKISVEVAPLYNVIFLRQRTSQDLGANLDFSIAL